jgi:hypothetical protein
VIVFLAQLLNKLFQNQNDMNNQNNSCVTMERLFFGTDINMEACKATQLTAKRNQVFVETICTRFLQGIEQRCSGSLIHFEIHLVPFFLVLCLPISSNRNISFVLFFSNRTN